MKGARLEGFLYKGLGRVFFPALFVLMLVLAPAAHVTARTINVSPAGQLTLRQALASASSGDEIRVAAGTYLGNLTLDHDGLSLVGVGWPVIAGEERGSVLTVTGRKIRVSGFVVRGGGRQLFKDEAGIHLIGAHGSRISNNRLQETLHGIFVHETENCLVEGNVIHGRTHVRPEQRGDGIHLHGSPFARIIRNEISGTHDGIYVNYSHYSHVEANTVQRVRYGVHYMYSNHNTITGNRLTHNVAGAAIMYGAHYTLTANLLAHNRGVRGYGLLWLDAAWARCTGNLVYDNSTGLYLDRARQSEIVGNTIRGNDRAVVLENSEENIFSANSFFSNPSRLQVRGRIRLGRTNRFDREKRGNYWSGCRGVDADRDGVGDEPCVLQGVMDGLEVKDNAFQLYRFSPLAAVLQFMERLKIGALQSSAILQDRFPLMKPPLLETPGAELQAPQGVAPLERLLTALLSALMILGSFFVIRWGRGLNGE